MALTTEQKAAGTTQNGNYLVSASAGSGKTTVLTGRVFDIISQGLAKLNELLVLTFTNFAAQEMRQRIRDLLLENGQNKLAASVEAVAIQTYDAFALSLVKKYHSMIGLPANVKLANDTVISLQTKKFIREILNERYISMDEDIVRLITKYCYKNDANLAQFIFDFYKKVELRENKQAYLDTYIENHFNEEQMSKYFEDYFASLMKNIDDARSLATRFLDETTADKTCDILDSILCCKTYEEVFNVVQAGFKFPQKKASLDEKDKLLLDEIKNSVQMLKDFVIFPTLKERVDRELSTKPYVSTIIEITKELNKRLDAFKAKYSCYSFNDIFKFAMQIASIPEIRNKLINQFKYIMVDESQDTSDLQDKFISMISNKNVYAVGDIKQSIYKFRNANCELFQNKYDLYNKLANEDGKLLLMPHNFRSRGEVIDDNNAFFNALMRKSNGVPYDYSDGHKMIYGNTTYELYKHPGFNYHHEMIDYLTPEKNVSPAEYEARLIAADILKRKEQDQITVHELRHKNEEELELCTTEKERNEKVHDMRTIKYCDFAILIYAKTDFAIYQRVFNELGIPLYANFNESLKDNNFTLTFKSIVKLVSLFDKDHQSIPFKHAFASLLRSFLVCEKDDKIEEIILSGDFKKTELSKQLFEKIELLSEYSKHNSLEDFTNKTIELFDFYKKFISIGDISNNTELINYYVNLAKEMDSMNYSIEDYSNFYEELEKYDLDPEFTGSGTSTDAVKLMSIHASKGLQFKFVYFAGLYKSFQSGSKGSLRYDDEYGICIPNNDYEQVDSFFKSAISSKEKFATINEQLRVFYVALTRAEEKAILLNRMDYKKNPATSFDKCTSYLDFINLSGVDFESYMIDPCMERQAEETGAKEKIELEIKDSYKFNEAVYSHKKASKDKGDDVDNKALELGNLYHYYLELTDFKTKDTSFISNSGHREIIDRFLKNSLFDNSCDAKVCHEYAFYNEQTGINGVIDLLLVYEDHIDIVDFKLSHVDDEAYDRQVGIYKDYISTIVENKPINTYVLGILSGKMRKVN